MLQGYYDLTVIKSHPFMITHKLEFLLLETKFGLLETKPRVFGAFNTDVFVFFSLSSGSSTLMEMEGKGKEKIMSSDLR